MTYPPPPSDESNDPLRKQPDPGQAGYPPPNFPPPGAYPPPGQQPYGDPYAQQQMGGYPPPPPPMDPAGYGVGPTLSVGAAISYGWDKFKGNAGSWIAMAFIALLISGAVQGPFFFTTSTSAELVGGLLSFVVSVLLQAAFTKGALSELDGQRPTVGTFFQFTNIAVVFLVAVAVSIITTVGFVLLVVPGIAAIYLTWYALTFAIDRQLGVVDAIKSSFRLTTQHAGQLIVLALACVALNIVGALLCLVGLLVTAPVTLIAGTYAYRVLTQGAVSPAAG